MNDALLGSVRVGTFRVGFGPVRTLMTWELGTDGELGVLVEEVRDFETLTLVLRSDEEITEERLNPLSSHAGDVEATPRANGGFSAEDRAGGENTYTLHPPSARENVRTENTWHVDQYDQTPVDQASKQYEVTVRLTASENKDPTTDYPDQEPADGEWLFEAHNGAIATSRVLADVRGRGEGVGEGDDKTLRLILTPLQTRIMEENASQLNAVVSRNVPDGTGYSQDNSPNQRNTLTVTAPSNDHERLLKSGDYAVEAWATEWLNDDFYEVELDLTRLG